jgi:hypothetical protein
MEGPEVTEAQKPSMPAYPGPALISSIGPGTRKEEIQNAHHKVRRRTGIPLLHQLCLE